MEDYDQMYRAVAYFAFKYGKIDRLESHNEYWLFQDAKLRTDFNIPGYKSDEMDKIKYKSKMKQVFLSHDIPVALGKVFQTAEEGWNLLEQFGYPVIVKPDSGVTRIRSVRPKTSLIFWPNVIPMWLILWKNSSKETS